MNGRDRVLVSVGNIQLPASKPPSVNMLLIDGVWQDIFFGLKVNFLILIRVWRPVRVVIKNS